MKLFMKNSTKKETVEVREKEKNELDGLIDPSAVNSIYPFSFKENKATFEAGENYSKVLTVVEYPDERRGNWLSDLKRMKGNITITQYIEPMDNSIMVSYYNNTIKNKDAELLRTHDPSYKIKLQKEMKSAKYQLEEALNGNSNFVYLYTYILLQADTPEELEILEDKVQRVLIKLNIKAIAPCYKMLDGYWSTLPLSQNLLKEYTYQMSNTTAAASFFPFDDNEICDLSVNSQIEGINKKSNSLIAINYLNNNVTLNQNMIVIGTSGVGKTTYIKKKILNLIAQGHKIFIMDPENEYTELVERYGGTVIHLSSASSTFINPLEIYSDEITDDDLDLTAGNKFNILVKQKCQRLKGFFKVIKENMTQVEISVVEGLLIDLYNNMPEKDITKLNHTDFPILEDLYKKCEMLKEEDPEKFEIIKDFYYILHSYVYGSNSLFNGYTNVDLTSNIVSFDLKPLQTEKDVQGACYLNTFSYLWDTITKTKRGIYTYMFADEFHAMIQNEEACDFFFQSWKRFRKYHAGAIATTQQINDVLKAQYSGGDIAAAIVENSYTKVFFGLDNKGVEEVVDKLKLSFSDAEVTHLRGKRMGEALLIYGTKRVFLKNVLSKEELRIIDPYKYKEKYEEDPNKEPDFCKELIISPLEIEEIKSNLRSKQAGGRYEN